MDSSLPTKTRSGKLLLKKQLKKKACTSPVMQDGVASLEIAPSEVSPKENARDTPMCSRRGCKLTGHGPPQKCRSCDRFIHEHCYQSFVLLSNSSNNKALDPLKEGIVCTKACYKKVRALSIRRPPWNGDGKKGAVDPNNSERILLDWLMTPGNYARFRGKDNNGKTKAQFCKEIADKMTKMEVRVERDAKQVLSKIQHLELSFRRAHDFANTATGEGLKEGDTSSFKEAVEKLCPNYFDLLEVMGDRASAKPKATTAHLDSSSSDDDNESDTDMGGKTNPPPEISNIVQASVNTDVSLSESSVNKKETTSFQSPPTKKRKTNSSITPSSRQKKTINLLSEEMQEEMSRITKKKKSWLMIKLLSLKLIYSFIR